MLFRQLFDPHLAQYAYLVGCQRTGEALVIDPERDIDRYVAAAAAEGLRITAVAETHIHADFLSGARAFAEHHGARVYVSAEGGPDWQSEWAKDPAYDAVFLRDGDTFSIGQIDITALHTPGHTPEHLSFVVVDRGAGATTPIGIATGDFVFVGDLGRPDLLEQAAGLHGVQEPAARTLFHSLPRFTALPEYVQVWPAHGAGSACGKALGAVPTTTVGYEKRYNASLGAAADGEEAFVQAILAGQPEPPLYFGRMKRDNKVGVPLLPGGRLPTPRVLAAGDVADVLQTPGLVVLDGRTDRAAFMDGHLPGSLAAPVNKAFGTVVGSLVEDADAPLLLVADAALVEQAVRDLVRIGYDRVVATLTPETLNAYAAGGGALSSIPRIDTAALAEALAATPGAVVVDARYASEYAAGHVPGALSASYTRLPDYAPERLPAAGTPLFVHCLSGARSAAASSYLARLGHAVTYVDGPFSAYTGPVAQGLPASVAA